MSSNRSIATGHLPLFLNLEPRTFLSRLSSPIPSRHVLFTTIYRFNHPSCFRSSKYSSRVMSTVFMLFLIISTSISLYSGITTARLAPGQIRIWCQPFLRLYSHPYSSNTRTKVFQSTGIMRGITAPARQIFQSPPSPTGT